jgi:hypothetical protein
MARSLEELESLKVRLEGDLRRSRMIDPDGITRSSPLFRNITNVNREIAEVKAGATQTTTEVL